MTFSILGHLDKLELAKPGRYFCPNCKGNNFTINQETGAYACWSGCKSSDIRNAIAPWGDRNQQLSNRIVRPKTPQRLEATLPDQLVLALLPQPVDVLQPQQRLDRCLGQVQETSYSYADDKWKVRIQWADANKPKGHSKKFVLWHRDASGNPIAKAGEGIRPPYRIDEAIAAAIASDANALMGCEGEAAVECYRQMGLACITLSSFSKDELALMAQLLKDAGLTLVYHPDYDEAGQAKAFKIQEVCDRADVCCITLNPVALCPNLPESGDIAEILMEMDGAEFIRRLEEQIHRTVDARQQSKSANDSEPVTIPDSLDPDTEFTQKALSFLYGDRPWICANDKLYFWTGNHYKHSPDAVERPKIASFCNSYPVQQKDGSIRYPYAKPSKVREALQWVKDRLEVDPSLLNPPGLNCVNGVLKLAWDGSSPKWQLVGHDPALYYTYEPAVTYNPDADATNCDRLLAVLDAPQRDIFLKSVAASLDLATVRQHKGRLVRGLLLKGHGSNGKDTLRECVAAMYGYRGMTSATLTDFAAYDQGRKFPLARLSNSRVNWASENANTTKLDKIQSLKAFITGDPISIEGKGRDEYDFNPVGIALFNVNDTPNLQASMDAIKTRYGVLTFNKTFKIGADSSKGELEADPRFKYDPDFLRSEVLPAFLNRVLDALTRLMTDGIDYSCTQRALESIQAENSHLFQFCQETGLEYAPDGTVSAGEIWQRLEQWYQDNATLTYEQADKGRKKSLWVDQVRRDDANVKGANQVIARFQSLFPKAKRVTVGKGKMALQGLSFNPIKPDGEPVEPHGEAIVSQFVSQKPLSDKDGEPVTPVLLLDEKNEIGLHDLEQCDRSNQFGDKKMRQPSTTQIPHDATRDPKTGLPHFFKPCLGETQKKEALNQNLTQLPHHPVIASDSASSTGVTTDPLANETASPTTRAIAPTKSPSITLTPQQQVDVFICDQWISGVIISSPNDHPNPQLRVAGWKVKLATGRERYIWDESQIRRHGST